MSHVNCPICGRVFEKQDFYEVCKDCFEEDQLNFNKVRDYLYTYGSKNILEISQATGVSIEKIQKYLRQGRLISS